ncbi:MAG: zinc dependent phospholipase C family protein [Eubacteriales bacterium]|nr:zinc dependent phospholipase C family protein [Eubacteriales bacterium]
MRKKSHISLAKYMVEQSGTAELWHHRKAFYLGNILPDCRPSFLTERHEFYGTFEKIGSYIRSLTEDSLFVQNTMTYWRRLGEVIHYIADYFTFPHNGAFQGTLREHCAYEKRLRDYLREYISSGRAARQKSEHIVFENTEELLGYIRSSHQEYMRGRHSVEDDVRHIVGLCGQVIAGIIQILERSRKALDGLAFMC